MTLSTAFLLFLPLAYIVSLLHRALTSPLRSIPAAHWSSRLSSLYVLYTRYRRRENFTLLRLHRTHGPVVLLSPTELSVNDLAGLRTIYVGGWEKPAWYSVFMNFEGTPNMFTMLDSKAHAARKRVVSGVYAKSNLLASDGMAAVREDVIERRFLGELKRAADRSKGVKVEHLLGRMAMDAMSEFIFGKGGGTGFLEDGAGWNDFLEHFRQRGRWAFLPQELPGLEAWCGWAGTRTKGGRAWTDAWCRQLCERAEERAKGGEIPDGQAPVWKALTSAFLKEQGDRSDAGRRLVGSEVLDHLLAGFETTSIALTFALYHLSKEPKQQEALRKELQNLSAKVTCGSTKAIDSLPLLSALITETLRLNPSIPGPQPRITSEGAFINGYGPLPKDTRVSSNAFCLHHNEDVYYRADEWIPERWLSTKDTMNAEHEEKLKEMQRWFWAFGSGGRMCVGSNFALLNMKLALCAIYNSFETSVMGASRLEQMDAYTAGPTEELVISFRRI